MWVVVSKYLVPKGYRGMTIFPFVIVRIETDANDTVLILHERIHIRQQVELLVIGFFVWYGIEYAIRLIRYQSHQNAYRGIGFEREAYANEKSPGWLKSRPFWNFIKYL